MQLPTTTVGKKILMAATGQFMVVYVIAHLLGNLTFFFSAVNDYAAWLRAWPGVIVLWGSRFLLLLSLVLHTWYGAALKIENRRARPDAYAVLSYRQSTFAARTMFWTGVVIFLFLIYHILHFTVPLIDPALGRNGHDIGRMIVRGFESRTASFIYLVSMAALLLHLMHGIQSSFQTWGLADDRTLPVVVRTGLVVSAILFLGYAAIPLGILTGIFGY